MDGFGLPKVLADLLRSQMQQKDLNLSWNFFHSGICTELVLKWTPPGVYTSPVDPGTLVPVKVFKKKAPSQLRRERQRK